MFYYFKAQKCNVILIVSNKIIFLKIIYEEQWMAAASGGELLEMRLLDKKWNRSFFYLPYVYQYLT
jgi:uncharacterized membrane protein YobD (UPF0266 family)